ncbi:MAG: fumarate hydratase [Oscillospiraceae bacterium]|nr:fumarate hydratase [Oscillospiraceae bacterium]
MRDIHYNDIASAVEKLCIRAAVWLPADIAMQIECASECEVSPAGTAALEDIMENFKYAAEKGLPICQDTGMAVVFAEVGQEVHITGGAFEDAVNEGVRRGYINGFLRKSVVSDPLRRVNTEDNTPAVIHTRLVPGDKLKITVAPKGFGSENMSKMKMFLPSNTQQQIIDFITECVSVAGAQPCPPVIVGVGLGGTVEKAALLAKQALSRPVDTRNADKYYADMEMKCLEQINALGIGPQGFGGNTTALAVNIEVFPTHIAGLPCVVNMGCHATRHADCVL